jgi:transcription termination/antitermination protein NusA
LEWTARHHFLRPGVRIDATTMFSWLPKAAEPVPAQKAGAPADRAGDALTSRCRELGVEAGLSEIDGISPPMLVALGENGIKTVEDLAGCATDDLHGWVEQTSGTTTRHAGVLDSFGLSRDECGAIIMKARARVGWIDESSPAQPAKVR